MIGKCKAIAHGSTALDYIFREGKLGKTLLFHNLCGTTPKEIYEEMKMVNDYNTRCRNKFLRIEIGFAPKDEPRLNLTSVRNLASNFAGHMGLADHQLVAVTHKDTDNMHIMFLYDLNKSGVTIERLKNKQGKVYDLKFSYCGQTFKASEIGREFGYRSLQKNFEVANKAETKETITKAHTMAHETTKDKTHSYTGYQLVPPSRSYISPTKANESSSIAQAVGNVASTALNAAEEMILGAGGLINPQTHGDDYAEMAWQHKLRNQIKKKKKRGRGI